MLFALDSEKSWCGTEGSQCARYFVGKNPFTLARFSASIRTCDCLTQAAVTPKGKAMTDRIDAARERLLRAIFRKWPKRDVDELLRLMQKFSAAINSPRT
jgi:hypothetical protein